MHSPDPGSGYQELRAQGYQETPGTKWQRESNLPKYTKKIFTYQNFKIK